jgi:thiol-disulfide isomerase/thioredoxin
VDSIINAANFSGYTYLYNQSAKFDPVNKGAVYIPVNDSHTGSCTLTIVVPQFVTFASIYSLVKGKNADKNIAYTLYVTPGDDLNLKIDPNKKDKNIVAVTGKGSNNNQPEILALTDIFSASDFENDKMPYRAIAAIHKQQKINKALLNNYIARYKPGNDFINACRLNLTYYAAVKYLYLKTRNLDAAHNYGPWQNAQDSLFNSIKISDGLLAGKLKDAAVTANLNHIGAMAATNSKAAPAGKLNNDAALVAYNYRYLVSFFTERENERLMIEAGDNPTAFYKEQYHTTAAKGKLLFTDEQKSLLRETIINKYFTGKTAEFLYAEWIKENLYKSDYNNIALIFDHFKQKYPTSKYIAEFTAQINAVVNQQKKPLTDKMVFVADNGAKLNRLKDVLALTKGKTVLVDMWGTWCSPCRKEIEENSAALVTYFKGKGVDFLYIANGDTGHEKEWKKLIAYYHVEGMHILANDKLTRDIMGKLKSNEYPTCFIIKKDGTYQRSHAGFPMDRQEMISELLAAL